MATIGTVGIILGVICLIYFSYKGLAIYYLAPLCALLVALFNGLPLLTSFTDMYMKGMADFIIAMFPITLLGAMLGRLYGDSGAASSIAKGIMDRMSKGGTTEQKKQLITVIIIMLTGAVLTYGGIDAFACLFATFPVAVTLMKENNIPRLFLP
ncbi:GntP family permease, partial [Deltaproteobacteria bacterium]|nr:GntP family permease [Deltaproteobacteria bacterium]